MYMVVIYGFRSPGLACVEKETFSGCDFYATYGCCPLGMNFGSSLYHQGYYVII